MTRRKIARKVRESPFMKFDPDIIRTILFSASTRDPSVLPQPRDMKIDKHKRLLLEHGFASGDETRRNDLEKPTIKFSCSIDGLNVDGQSLLNLSSNEAAWKRAKRAYAEEGCSWSLPQFHAFLKIQARRENQTVCS